MRTMARSALRREYNRSMAQAEVASQIHLRSKRFVHPASLPEFKLTPRALALVAYAAKYRLISSDDLALLDAGSAQNVKRELRILWAHRYLLRPSMQLNTVAITGPQPLVYGISNRGARLLRDHGHLIDDIDWSGNCRRAGATFIDHTVACSRFMAAIEVAQRGRADITLLETPTVVAQAPEKTQRARYPLKWTALVPDGRGGEMAASVISDDAFALVFDDGTAAYFVIEIDRGQMPVRRSPRKREEIVSGKRRLRTYYMHKLATYYHGWRQRRHVEQFGVEQVRVLTVTTSTQRIETMLDAQREITNGKGSDLFMFIDEERLQSCNPLDAEWITGKGKTAKLTD
jgi:Replication-relaxation